MAAKAKQRALTSKGMASHGQKISRGLLAGSELRCTDNTGARVLRRPSHPFQLDTLRWLLQSRRLNPL